MASPLDGMTGWEVVGGTAGVSSPWANNSGTVEVSNFDRVFGGGGGAIGKITGDDGGIKQTNDLLKNWQGNSADPGQSKFNGWMNFFSGAKPDLSPEAAASGTAGSPKGGGIEWINEYFIRGVIVILGFIFVAAGLTMMGRGDNIVQAVKGAA